MSHIPKLPTGLAGSTVGFWGIPVCFPANLSVSAENPVGFFKNRLGPARNRLDFSQTRPDVRQPKPLLSPIRSGSERNRREPVQSRPQFQPLRLGVRQLQPCPSQGEFAMACASCRNSARRRATHLEAGSLCWWNRCCCWWASADVSAVEKGTYPESSSRVAAVLPRPKSLRSTIASGVAASDHRHRGRLRPVRADPPVPGRPAAARRAGWAQNAAPSSRR